MRSRIAISAVVAAITSSCSEARSPSTGTDGAAVDNIRELAESAAIFSFQYEAEPPTGRRLHLVAISDVDDACALFENAGHGHERRVLNVVTSFNSAGAYRVERDPDFASDEDSALAYVEVVSGENGNIDANVRAVSGQVQLVEAPIDERAWSSSAVAEIQVQARIETDPVAASECSAGQATGSMRIESSCHCKRLSGKVFDCEATDGKTCCYDEVGPTALVEFSLRARACAAACAATQPELLVHCRNLLGR